MEWVEGFYSRTGRWWGPAEGRIKESDHRRLAAMERLAGAGAKRVLDLGSSYGTTAAVMAEAGHRVVGVEISYRMEFARGYEGPRGAGSARFVRGDFYEVVFDQRFDVVCYWNGFGVGTDADQRRLLRRVADEWLSDEGIAMIDVAHPARWIQWTGEEESLPARPEVGYGYNVTQRIDFDPVRNRFVDTWWQTERPEERVSQSVRCYAPPDFLLLLEGTGLGAERMEVGGESFDLDEPATSGHPLWRAHEYLAALRVQPT